MSLRILSYIAPHQGDLLILKVHIISCLERKSSKDSVFGNCLIHSAVALKAPPLSEMITAGLVFLAMNAFKYLMNSSAVWDLMTSRCMALITAQVNMTTYALASCFFPTL